MRHYEVMIILDPSQDERTVAPSLDKFLEIVRNDNGKVENVDVWGKRRLAYPIDKKEEGVYAVVNLDCTSETVLELDRRLNLSDSILRTKVLRTDNK
ncbi:30S ribosomal protein S6 [Corynebacterium aquatimens]|uniref:30S ribosomal protein S6 n=1 Tax=Corynebacterium aquatimens TaxID=1190508 RepID=UPI0018CB1F09|nr:30S ribosomal protein S6 [Corynebacterium aquatimens]WJY66880.1 30S ribosomal protein S6 [Corynebacterium aquatimens]